jgi:hypothetical protein
MYKGYHIAYLKEQKIWNIAKWFSAGWQFYAEFKTLKECRKWLMEVERGNE